jgi:transposase
MGSLRFAPLLGLAPLKVERIRFAGDAVVLDLISTQAFCCCPVCGQRSCRVHSHYCRRLADLPAHGRTIELNLRLCRFFCDHPDCPKQTFAEPLPRITQPHARRTCRLAGAIQEIAFAAGGEAGSRLARHIGIITSPDTLLRLTRDNPLPTAACGEQACAGPRVLGVDDWAFHRGQRYGTILCDLELHRPVDLLPERSAAGFAAWLHEHPGVEFISRDRGADYAKGATLGAPQAKQIADRWHLLHNLIEVFEQALNRQHAMLAEVAKTAMQPAAESDLVVMTDPPAASSNSILAETVESAPRQPTRRQQRQEQSSSRRQARFDQVKELRAQGMPLRRIAVQLRLSRCTVRRYAHTAECPDHAPRPQLASLLDPFMPYLRRRWDEGCHLAAQLYHEIKDQGFTGSRYMVRRRVAAWRDHRNAADIAGLSPATKPRSAWRPSARSVVWLLLKPDKVRSAEQQMFLAELASRWPALAENVTLIEEFRQLLSGSHADDLPAWVELAGEPAILPEIKRFAENLSQDWQAVIEAIRQPWSNGQVEGQVNRLKLIKRQMYGRANFDLLRAKVLHMS